MTIRHLFWPAVASILAIVGTLEVRSARGETQTWDEGIHIVAGYSYLKLGDYSWNVEHPPLVKMVSALPLALMGLTRGAFRSRRQAQRPGPLRGRFPVQEPARCRFDPAGGAQRQYPSDSAVRRCRGVVDAPALRAGSRPGSGRTVRVRPESDGARPLCDHRFPGHGILLLRLRALGGVPGRERRPRRLLAAAVAIGLALITKFSAAAADSAAGDSVRRLLDPAAEGVSPAPCGTRRSNRDRRGTRDWWP